jgi:hypothetical protein
MLDYKGYSPWYGGSILSDPCLGNDVGLDGEEVSPEYRLDDEDSFKSMKTGHAIAVQEMLNEPINTYLQDDDVLWT